MLYDSIVLASWRILPIIEVSACSRSATTRLRKGKLTRVDQLLLRHFPALVTLDLGLEFANLEGVLEDCNVKQRCILAAYRFRWLGLDDELVLLEILRKYKLRSYTGNAAAQYLECDLHGGS